MPWTTTTVHLPDESNPHTNCPNERHKISKDDGTSFCRCENTAMGFSGRNEIQFLECCAKILSPIKDVNCSDVPKNLHCGNYMDHILNTCYYPLQSITTKSPTGNTVVSIEPTKEMTPYTASISKDGVSIYCSCQTSSKYSKTFHQCCEKYFQTVRTCMMAKQKNNCVDGNWRQRCSHSSFNRVQLMALMVQAVILKTLWPFDQHREL
ncbi:uncharacterized protein LOC142350908 isoform X2 [Convolutriloba macropyga]|uniref:uncharacterized protein LOC142350908 isoform X2 n=1 Tax=Convolutriloba macropyga TaxID=536237 RepID=UPI003F520B61